MSRCLKCNYELALLERRHKYKCAKCSSLFTEEEIKLEEFKKYNKVEREKEKKDVKKETQRVKIEAQRKYREEHREEHNRYRREWWAKNRERILLQRKENNKNGKQNETRKARRKNNIESTRINGRIGYWKRKQRVMAESRFDEFFHQTKVINKYMPY